MSGGVLPIVRADRAEGRRIVPFALGAILAVYLCARILEVVPSTVPRMAIVALDVLSAMAFALVDGARRYGLRGILVFAAIFVSVGNIIENVGVATGFPFGDYEFLELIGPKLFHVPVLLGLAYIGMGYVSLVLATAILRVGEMRFSGVRFWIVPMLAGAIMTSWDLAQDPVWATVLHGWTWRKGGAWFGVPISNYFGWYATNLVIYLLFATYLRRGTAGPAETARANVAGSILFYLLCAAGNVLQLFASAGSAVVQDPSGKVWRVADILHASALVSIFIMGSFAALAWTQSRAESTTAID